MLGVTFSPPSQRTSGLLPAGGLLTFDIFPGSLDAGLGSSSTAPVWDGRNLETPHRKSRVVGSNLDHAIGDLDDSNSLLYRPSPEPIGDPSGCPRVSWT